MFIEKKDIKKEVLGEGHYRLALGCGQNLNAVETYFMKKGIYAAPHIHENHEQFIMVLKGKFELMCGEEKRIMVPGDCYYATPGELHDALCLEDGSVLLDVHYPPRMDILNSPNAVPEE